MRGSISTTITFFATSSNFKVMLPVPRHNISKYGLGEELQAERKGTRADFEDSVGGLDLGLLNDAVDDQRVLQKVLTELLFYNGNIKRGIL